MKTLMLAIAASAVVVSAGSAFAQPDEHAGWAHDQGASHHWQHGERMGYNDWSGAHAVDYRQHHLRRPQSGYEWRESNGQFVLGAIATGVIASAIVADHR